MLLLNLTKKFLSWIAGRRFKKRFQYVDLGKVNNNFWTEVDS